MFWKGKVSIFSQIYTFLRQSDVSLVKLEEPSLKANLNPGNCKISVSKFSDTEGMAKLLNEWFEEPSSRSKANVTKEWIRSTYLSNHAIWIVAKDSKGTIRGCVSSFISEGPYPNSLSQCSGKQWGIVDWFCVHPLWRSKGLGSALLETLDLVTYKVGRKAHVFLKEGVPLPLPHIPIYFTWLKCRKAGNPRIKHIQEDSGLILYPYMEVERETGIPLIRVEGLTTKLGVSEWEAALDKLPECWVFTSSNCITNRTDWKTDSLISMYAFRWSPGKWLGSIPNSTIL